MFTLAGVHLEHTRRYPSKLNSAEVIFVPRVTKMGARYVPDVAGPLFQRSQEGQIEWHTLLATPKFYEKLTHQTTKYLTKIGDF